MDWYADYLPLGNWVAYGVAGALIILLIFRLQEIKPENRQAWIFRPLMLGLFLSAAIGLIQASTGLGLSEAQLAFRKDSFGYAAMGMQPDLHAFAAHMLLGVVGLWGYFFASKSKVEKYAIVLVFFTCLAALVASKSRASLLIAAVALAIMALVFIYRHSKKYFVIAFTAMLGAIALMIFVAKVSQGIAKATKLVELQT
jgi:hypothetical protein